MMIVLEYVARFTELARFGDDYVATDAAQGQEVRGWAEVVHPGQDYRT